MVIFHSLDVGDPELNEIHGKAKPFWLGIYTEDHVQYKIVNGSLYPGHVRPWHDGVLVAATPEQTKVFDPHWAANFGLALAPSSDGKKSVCDMRV